MNIEKVLKLASDNDVANVDLKFTDLYGGLHHISIPVESLRSELFENGIGLDGSSIPGFKSSGASDMIMRPDPQTATLDPFWDRPTLTMFGSVYEIDDRIPFPLDPRQVVQKAENYLKSTGIADRSLWGPEFEFNIFDSVKIINKTSHVSYEIESSEAGFSSKVENCGRPYAIPYQRGYHSAPPRDLYFNIRDAICAHAKDFGIKVKYHHHEVGSTGQTEIEIEHVGAVEAGDTAIIIKYLCKMVSQEFGFCITFMPKPIYNEAGNGMHFHQHLFKGDEPVFYNKNGYAGLSDTALYYIGGLLTHGPALLAFTNPSTNSYKRLVPGFEAPIKTIFGLGNRSAAVRIPKYATEPAKKRIEFRPPDGSCNAYLAVAAQLMAGIDGIINKIDPRKSGLGPFDEDISKLSDADRDAIPSLPTRISETIEAVKKDHKFLLAGNVFTEELIHKVTNKLSSDDREIQNRPHPYEMELYFDS